MPNQAMSASCTGAGAGQSVSEWHDRRNYTPDSAEPTLIDRNVAFVDAGRPDPETGFEGGFKAAVNKEFAPDIEEANARLEEQWATPRMNKKTGKMEPGRRRPELLKGPDYYDEVAKGKDNRKPLIEMVINVGNRDVCGVCDDEFDDDEWHALKDADKRDGTHTASDYVQAHLSTGEKGKRHDDAVAILTDVAGKIRDEMPDAMKVMGIFLHDDEPDGSPHLHVVLCPIATGYSKGMKRRIGQEKALKSMGIKSSRTNPSMPQFYNKIRDEFVEPVMNAHGYDRELVGNTEKHLGTTAFKAKTKLEKTVAEAEQAEAARDAAQMDAANAMWAANDAKAEAETASKQVAEERAAVDVDKAALAIERDGYTPPEKMTRLSPDYESGAVKMPPAVREAWDAWKADPSEKNAGTVKAFVHFGCPSAEGRSVSVDASGIYIFDEKDAAAVAAAQAAGIDPMKPHGGIAAREAAVAEGERANAETKGALDEREAVVSKGEAELEPKRHALNKQKKDADERDKKLDERENDMKRATLANMKDDLRRATELAAKATALDKREKELDEQEEAQKSQRETLDTRESNLNTRTSDLDRREQKIKNAETDARDVRERADAYARIRVQQADEYAATPDDPVGRLKRNPLTLFNAMAERAATYVETRMNMPKFAAGIREVCRRLGTFVEKHDGLFHALANGIGDALRETREAERTVPMVPTEPQVTLEQHLHRSAPVAPASAEAWAQANEAYTPPVVTEDRNSGLDEIEM